MPSLIDELINRNLESYPHFIQQIRFPLYKKLEPNSVLTFDFPLTALVGPNGSGKTSVLQALYGCPSGRSTGEYWFSTNVDPINESNNWTPKNLTDAKILLF